MNNPEDSNDYPGIEIKPGEQTEGRLETLKIYLKDASFESPLSPGIFATPSTQPKFESQLGLDIHSVEEDQGVYEIVLRVTVTSQHEGKTLYLAEVHQAGIFQLVHPDKDKLRKVMEVTCPHILLPFAREELNSLITKGGFSPFLLAPVNFESLYRSKADQTGEENAENAGADTKH